MMQKKEKSANVAKLENRVYTLFVVNGLIAAHPVFAVDTCILPHWFGKVKGQKLFLPKI